MNKEKLEFATFCVGAVANSLNCSRQDVYERLKSSGIFKDYIVKHYRYHLLNSNLDNKATYTDLYERISGRISLQEPSYVSDHDNHCFKLYIDGNYIVANRRAIL